MARIIVKLHHSNGLVEPCLRQAVFVGRSYVTTIYFLPNSKPEINTILQIQHVQPFMQPPSQTHQLTSALTHRLHCLLVCFRDVLVSALILGTVSELESLLLGNCLCRNDFS